MSDTTTPKQEEESRVRFRELLAKLQAMLDNPNAYIAGVSLAVVVSDGVAEGSEQTVDYFHQGDPGVVLMNVEGLEASSLITTADALRNGAFDGDEVPAVELICRLTANKLQSTAVAGLSGVSDDLFARAMATIRKDADAPAPKGATNHPRLH